jgi:hypothetical protein
MDGEKRGGGKPEKPVNPPTKTDEIVLQPSGEVVVRHEEQAARAPEGKQIHPRRMLPLIPEARPEPGVEERPKTDGADSGSAATGRQEP